MKNLLAVIDMQNDFVTGSLGTKEAQAIVPNVKDKISDYALRKDNVIFTRDTHEKDYLDTQEGKLLPVEHCIRDTEGWLIENDIEDDVNFLVLELFFPPITIIEFTFLAICSVSFCLISVAWHMVFFITNSTFLGNSFFIISSMI